MCLQNVLVGISFNLCYTCIDPQITSCSRTLKLIFLNPTRAIADRICRAQSAYLRGFNEPVNPIIGGEEEFGNTDLDGKCWQHCNRATETCVVLVFFLHLLAVGDVLICFVSPFVGWGGGEDNAK